MTELVIPTEAGLFCEAGGFHIDPWKPVPFALVTHAHADHALPGSGRYLCAKSGRGIFEHRVPGCSVEPVDYGQRLELEATTVSFHPAGHVLGSAQIRVEHAGEVWVISGDYKRQPDPTCAPFEPLRCDVFITEATFGLPVYRWDATEDVMREICRWWEEERAAGRTAVLFANTLGKAPRILAELARLTDRTVYVHGAIAQMAELYRHEGVALLPTQSVVEAERRDFAGELVLAPLSARGTPWMKRLGETREAYASGWMRVRGERRRRNLSRGFALSDHADFPALVETVRATGARDIRVTHGYREPFSRYLRELGFNASILATPFKAESSDE